jgi:hypothetical protein
MEKLRNLLPAMGKQIKTRRTIFLEIFLPETLNFDFARASFRDVQTTNCFTVNTALDRRGRD